MLMASGPGFVDGECWTRKFRVGGETAGDCHPSHTIHRGARRARILIEAFFALRATVVSAWRAPTKSRARRPRARGPRASQEVLPK